MSTIVRRQEMSLVAVLSRFARERGEEPALTFLDYSQGLNGEPRTHTYAETDHAAASVAAELSRRCPPGSRVAITGSHDFEFVTAFLGCLYSGRIAVPLPPAESHRKNDRILSAVADAQPALVLTGRQAVTKTATVVEEAGIPAKSVCAIADLIEPGTAASTPEPAPDTVAYLQYTSGSTGSPAGVRISHGNMAANARQISEFAGYLGPGTPLVSWVPFFHDLGLITGLVAPLSVGAHVVHLSPIAFVQSPYRWLKAVSDYRSAWMVGPNFSYELCATRVRAEQKRALDLSSLRGLVSGGEPVRPESQRVFAEAFADCGLTADLDAGAYGLAEATLCVTAHQDEKGKSTSYFDRAELTGGRVRGAMPGPGSVALASCGTPVSDVRIAIVDPESGVEAAPDEVGEIWVSGPNVADGYWRKPELTEQTFHSALWRRDGRADGDWLRTGDTGFLSQNRLFVLGRRKEMLIVDGRNHYPADIEATVRDSGTDSGLGGVAVFAVEEAGREVVVAVAEAHRGDVVSPARRTAIETGIRRAVSAAHGIALHEVVLVPWGAIPRTSSHKIRRLGCRDEYTRRALRRFTERDNDEQE
ncbi:fatty acyl-AMP ligase [Amycolatopsis sp. NPDC059657]|uniref:fatty acyl-AMP ligase n=1 Tax=Amycolatopsis sp. NPDC059657 TaxID=3346899 RepID=UPI0036717132